MEKNSEFAIYRLLRNNIVMKFEVLLESRLNPAKCSLVFTHVKHFIELGYKLLCYCVVRGLMQRVMGMESKNGLDNRENIKYVVRFLIDSGVVA